MHWEKARSPLCGVVVVAVPVVFVATFATLGE
jgi:hypothetical protein